MLSEQLLQGVSQSSFCIYGAGIVAASIYTAIKTLYHKIPRFFLVSDSEGKEGVFDVTPTAIDGIVVKRFSEWKGELSQAITIPTTYLVAVPEEHHAVIIEALCSHDFLKGSKVFRASIEEPCIIPVTNALENKLMERYYCSLSRCDTISSILAKGRYRVRGDEENRCRESFSEFTEMCREATGQEISSVQIYQAKSHMDKPINNQNSQSDRLEYLNPIQVGTALTDCQIAGLQDNQGDNISAKNRNYCELTATYYAWKHSHAAYKGICHYRRIFDISEEQMQNLLQVQQEWDVILPYPSIHYPNISAQHSRYVKESDWDAMLRALEEVEPEYLEAYEKSVAAGEQFFHNFNMLIAKAPVFDDYCDFLFRVLQRTEELTTPKGWERADRFAGYLGENLTTIYFIKNRDKWKIAYAGKIWLT